MIEKTYADASEENVEGLFEVMVKGYREWEEGDEDRMGGISRGTVFLKECGS